MQLSRLIRKILLAALGMTWSAQANALEFATLQSRGGGVALKASGEIAGGDVERFLAVAPYATQDANGYRRIILESPGGIVDVAMRVAVLLRQWNFITFVDDDCASACAMILYPAGVYSILGDKGRLGFHNCYSTRRDSKIIPECTEAIAQFATRNGMPYGSIRIFAGLRGGDEMLWVTNVLAHCYGFERLPGDQAPVTTSVLCPHVATTLTSAKQMAPSPLGPSFDCRKADEPVGMLLCRDEELMHLDAAHGTFVSIRTPPG